MLFVKRTTHDALRQERDQFKSANEHLREDYNALMGKYGTLEDRWGELLSKNAALEHALHDFGVAHDTLEEKKAELLVLLKEAQAIFREIPASKLTPARAVRITEWLMQSDRLEDVDGKAVTE